MLVLSRKLGEKIMIGDDVVVTVVDIDRNKVRLGIEAPRGVEVNRQEVHDRKVGSNGVDGVTPRPYSPHCDQERRVS